MPNTYTTDENGTYIVDRSGKRYRCNVAHPLPLPDGIEQAPDHPYNAEASILYATPTHGLRPWSCEHSPANDTHWLARAPLPEVPRPKTPEQKDEEAFQAAVKRIYGGDTSGASQLWHSALAYARQQQP